MRSRLIINADDFGLTPGINQAILELHRAGVVTSATLMAGGPAFEDAAQLALTEPTLGIGCHLVFVDGAPLSPPELIPSLLGAGGKTFRSSLVDFAQAALRGVLRKADLLREAKMQIQKLQRTGLVVTHLDTHKHTHLFPTVLEQILRAGEQCGVNALRNPFEPRWSLTLSQATPSRRLQLRAVQTLAAPAFRRLTCETAAGASLTDGTIGIAATGTLSAPVLRAIMQALLKQSSGATYELCCHPGHVDSALDAQTTRLRASREIEYRALLEVVPEILRSATAPELIHYGDLTVAVDLGSPRSEDSHLSSCFGPEKVS